MLIPEGYFLLLAPLPAPLWASLLNLPGLLARLFIWLARSAGFPQPIRQRQLDRAARNVGRRSFGAAELSVGGWWWSKERITANLGLEI